MSDYNITLFEACEQLSRSKKSISRYVRRGLLHPKKVKSQQGTLEYRFSESELKALNAGCPACCPDYYDSYCYYCGAFLPGTVAPHKITITRKPTNTRTRNGDYDKINFESLEEKILTELVKTHKLLEEIKKQIEELKENN